MLMIYNDILISKNRDIKKYLKKNKENEMIIQPVVLNHF